MHGYDPKLNPAQNTYLLLKIPVQKDSSVHGSVRTQCDV